MASVWHNGSGFFIIHLFSLETFGNKSVQQQVCSKWVVRNPAPYRALQQDLVCCSLDCFFCRTFIGWAKRDTLVFHRPLAWGGYNTFQAFLHLIFYLLLAGDLNREIRFWSSRDWDFWTTFLQIYWGDMGIMKWISVCLWKGL